MYTKEAWARMVKFVKISAFSAKALLQRLWASFVGETVCKSLEIGKQQRP